MSAESSEISYTHGSDVSYEGTADVLVSAVPASITFAVDESHTEGRIPVLEELHSSDSASSTDAEGDYLIPDLDALDATSEPQSAPTTSYSKRNQTTDDPQVLQRRARNRKAALECRKRQKDRTEHLEKEVNRLLMEEVKYQRQIKRTEDQLNTLKNLFKQHLPACPVLADRVRKEKNRIAQRNQRTANSSLARQTSGSFVPATS